MRVRWLVTVGWIACAIGSDLAAQVRLNPGCAAALTRADVVHDEHGLTGAGVLVAILDRGVAYDHPDFRNPDGTTRIEAILDLTANAPSGAASDARGVLYTRAQINSALRTGVLLPCRDATGHGTTSTGLACGNGAASHGQFVGTAPRADILVVKICEDAAPAHGDQPAAQTDFDYERLFPAIDFCIETAKRLEKPCVIVLNIGSVGGPTNGTSRLCRKIDSVVGKGKKRIVFVTGPCDDGSMPNRAEGFVGAGESVFIDLEKGQAAPLAFDCWYEPTVPIRVRVHLPGASNAEAVLGPWSENKTVDSSDVFYSHYPGALGHYKCVPVKGEYALNQIHVRLKGPPGTYRVELLPSGEKRARWWATLNPSSIIDAESAKNRFTSHVAAGNIWDGATAFNNICPGSFVGMKEWVDIDGQRRELVDQGQLGDLWSGSGSGPTFDGRAGVTLCAPGDRVFSTYNPRGSWGSSRSRLVVENDGYGYGVAGAVSAANPMTGGAIALLLEARPTLDAIEVRDLLQDTATKDAFTGDALNRRWGAGKLDIVAAVNKLQIKKK